MRPLARPLTRAEIAAAASMLATAVTTTAGPMSPEFEWAIDTIQAAHNQLGGPHRRRCARALQLAGSGVAGDAAAAAAFSEITSHLTDEQPPATTVPPAATVPGAVEQLYLFPRDANPLPGVGRCPAGGSPGPHRG